MPKIENQRPFKRTLACTIENRNPPGQRERRRRIPRRSLHGSGLILQRQFLWLGFVFLRAGSHAPISGMNAGRKSLFGRDLLKELAEFFTFVSGQRGAYRLHVLATDAAYITERAPTFLGQVQRVLTAVIGVWLAFDQPLFLERVEYSHQTTGMDAESRRELLLTESAGGAQHAQDPGVRRCEIEAGDPLAESHGCVRPYLGEQESQRSFCLLHNI